MLKCYFKKSKVIDYQVLCRFLNDSKYHFRKLALLKLNDRKKRFYQVNLIFINPLGQKTMGLSMDEWAGGDMLQCVYGDETIGTQCLYRTKYHIIWLPKYRRRILNPGVCGYLRKLFPKIQRSFLGWL